MKKLIQLKFRLTLVIFFLLICGSLSLHADSEDKTAEIIRHRPVNLTLQNRVITTFRAERLGWTPEQRVKGCNYILEQYISHKQWTNVSKVMMPEGVQILIHGKPALVITEGDLDLVMGETLESVSEKAVQNLRKALGEVREARNTTMIFQSCSYAMAATLIMLVIFWVLGRVSRKIIPYLEKLQKKRIGEVKVGGFKFIRSSQIARIWNNLVKMVILLIKLEIIYLWLTYVLKQFPRTRVWGETMGGFFLDAFKMVFLGILTALPNLITILVIFFLVRVLSRVLKLFFEAVEEGSVTIGILDAETAGITRRLILGVIWSFAFIMAYPYIPGSSSDAFKGIGVMFGLLVSLGSAGVVNQFASGLILIYSKALRAGEYVKIGETEGRVLAVGVLITKLMTPLNEEINIPNAVMVNSISKNYSRMSEDTDIVLQTSITIGYDTPWRQVEAMLIQAAEKTEGLSKSTPPVVLKSCLTDFYIEYRLNAQIQVPETRIKVKSNLHENILDIFNENDVQITSPNYVADPPEKQTVPMEKWFLPPLSGNNK